MKLLSSPIAGSQSDLSAKASEHILVAMPAPDPVEAVRCNLGLHRDTLSLGAAAGDLMGDVPVNNDVNGLVFVAAS